MRALCQFSDDKQIFYLPNPTLLVLEWWIESGDGGTQASERSADDAVFWDEVARHR